MTQNKREHKWQKGQIFVFGSNLHGIHGAGAAKFANENCGAILGAGQGKFGESYALPTCRVPGEALPIDAVGRYAARFNRYAASHPEMTFFLTRVGCGIAGFTDDEIKPFFAERLPNVIYPPEWD